MRIFDLNDESANDVSLTQRQVRSPLVSAVVPPRDGQWSS